METRANYVLIGLLFKNVSSTKLRTPLRIVFEGSASGLRNGGAVNFNGIRVGEVTSVKLDNPRRVVALAMIENVAPIRNRNSDSAAANPSANTGMAMADPSACTT